MGKSFFEMEELIQHQQRMRYEEFDHAEEGEVRDRLRQASKGEPIPQGCVRQSTWPSQSSLNVATVLERVAQEKITINVNGRRRQVTKLDAAAMQIANKSASGDLAATRLMFGLLSLVGEKGPDTTTEPFLGAEDRAILGRLLKRQERQHDKSGKSPQTV